jgi:hypothetical protein
MCGILLMHFVLNMSNIIFKEKNLDMMEIAFPSNKVYKIANK